MTLSYDICVKLKEAGYPQTPQHDFYEAKKVVDGSYTIPRLEELIEACGKIMLLEVEGAWFACTPMDKEFSFSFSETSYSQIDTLTDFSAKGKTPSEAVANLYLKLKQNE